MSNWPKGSRSSKLRRQAQRAIPYQCAMCGADTDLELDHKIGLADGGTDTLDNLQWLCLPHHEPKSSEERRRGIERAKASRGGHHSRRYRRQGEPHPGAIG